MSNTPKRVSHCWASCITVCGLVGLRFGSRIILLGMPPLFHSSHIGIVLSDGVHLLMILEASAIIPSMIPLLLIKPLPVKSLTSKMGLV